MAYLVDKTLSSEQSVKIDKLVTESPYYSDAVRLGRSLSLSARCKLPETNSAEQLGLHFLHYTLQKQHPGCWSRVRLAFDKKMKFVNGVKLLTKIAEKYLITI